MRRVLFAVLMFALIGATLVAVAQPPAPPAVVVPPASAVAIPLPKSLPATPAPLPATTATTESPLAQFEPLAAFPHQTQSAVRAVVHGSNWMTRVSQPQGRFLFGYNPALRTSLPGDHDLKQARAARGLAMAAKFTGDEQQAAVASQAILTLLAATRIDPADANCRVPAHSSAVCNRVGFAATLALAIYELPAADAKLVAEAERLCEFLHKQCKPDGSVHYTDVATDDPSKSDPNGMNEYPGLALHAIMVGNRVKPAAWKTEAAKKGVAYYRTKFRAAPHPHLAATLTPASAELYMQTKLGDAAAGAYEMNDWLCTLQIPGTDTRTPQWAGGFRPFPNGQPTDAPPDSESAWYVESLAYACQLTRLTPDLERNAKYRGAIADAVRFLCGLQYTEANTRHFENAFRANMLIGGFHLSPTDGNLRIDSTGNAVSGLVRYLSSGAEK